jgi:hypothetical protein
VAGRPEELQIMYGIRGERHLTEREVDWLPGYQGSRPVRDLWQQRDLGEHGGSFTATVPGHGSMLLKIGATR